MAYIKELKDSESLRDRMLSSEGLVFDTPVGGAHFEAIGAFRREADMDIWRLKACDTVTHAHLVPYRIIYAHHPWTQHDQNSYYMILAITHRDWNYEPNSEIGRRIQDEYRELRDIF